MDVVAVRPRWFARHALRVHALLSPLSTVDGDSWLRWDAPAECAVGGQVRADVRRLLSSGGGKDRNQPRPQAYVRVENLGVERWRAYVGMSADGVSTARGIEANSCAALAEASAVMLAMLVDPTAANAVPAPVVVSGAPPVVPERAPAAARPPWGALSSVSVAGGHGAVPFPALGVELTAGARYRTVSAELVFHATTAIAQAYPTEGSGRAELAMWELSLRPCARALPAPFHRVFGGPLAACAEASYAQLRGWDAWVPSDSATSIVWHGGMGLQWRTALVGPMGFVVQTWLRTPVVGVGRFSSGFGRSYEEPTIGTRLSLGLEFAAP